MVRVTEPLSTRAKRALRSPGIVAAAVLSLAAAAGGCEGKIAGLADSVNGGGSSAATGGGENGGVTVTTVTDGGVVIGPDGKIVSPGRSAEEAGYDEEDVEALYDRPAPATRVARLTHEQWENSVRDLFELNDTEEIPTDFRSDPSQQGFLFDNHASSLQVDESLWKAYQRSAAEMAERITSSGLSALLPAGTGENEEGARAFIVDFGKRAHRRPLTDEQVEDYLALYREGPNMYSGLDDFHAGIRLVIEAFLQSPYFVYRLEMSTEETGEVIPLDSYEVASRLSYMLWNTMPDETLFEAARAGELTQASQVESQAKRMLDDPRAEAVIATFHEQLLERDRYSQIGPAEAFYPDAPGDLASLAAKENELFLEHVYEQGGGVTELLTSTTTFVNDDLAEIYGLSGSYPSDDFVEASLDPSERSGLLTHIGFLASHATSVNPDPIHRGVFIAKHVTCTKIAAPPADIPPVPAPEGRTNRETIEDHTETEGTVCASCHATIINPFGFPFESYDSLGAHRTMDNGHPVDTSSNPIIGGE